MGATNITPQGYTYAIEPNTTHPFWKDGSGDSNYIYAELKNPVVFENTDKNFTRFDVVLEGDVSFMAPLTLSLVSVTVLSEVALPFVGVSHGDVAFLICEGIETNQLKVVGVYATTDMSALEIKHIISIPAPIKGDKGDNGQDGVTPQITATASVDQTTGVASVQVTKSGTDTHPTFDFAFTGIKGERGERGEKGQDGANGQDGATGVTPQITATATVDQTTGNAAVNVTKTGTDTNPSFRFDFTGLKGDRGERGEQGQAGANGNDGATGATGATPDIAVNATVDDTTGSPSVQVTKSGTLENPVFDLAFSGLKGEGGGGGSWQTLATTDGNIKDIMNQLNTLNATKVYLDKIKISGFQNGLYFGVYYLDSNNAIQKLSRTYSAVSISQMLHDVVAEKISDKWVCTGKFLLGDGGTQLRISDGTNDNMLFITEPKFIVSTNNLGVSDMDVQLVLSLVGNGSASVKISGTTYTVLSISFMGGFFVQNVDPQPVPYM